MVRWYNAEADFIDEFGLDLREVKDVTIIGNGNVATDVA